MLKKVELLNDKNRRMSSQMCVSRPVSFLPERMHQQTYSAARVIQELAKEGLPLPFGNRFWASNWPTQNAPFPGLLMNLIVTVSKLHISFTPNHSHSFGEVIVIIAPPQKVAYPFILDVSGYPLQIIRLFVVFVSVLPS